MADVTAGAARYASVAEVRADVERAGGDASVLCGFGRCFCVKTALGIRRKERAHLLQSFWLLSEHWACAAELSKPVFFNTTFCE